LARTLDQAALGGVKRWGEHRRLRAGTVDHVDHRAQASEAHAIEAEHEPRQVRYLPLALLFRQCLADLEDAVLQDVAELGVADRDSDGVFAF